MVTPQFDLIHPTDEEAALARRASRHLSASVPPGRCILLQASDASTGGPTEPVEIPAAAVPLIQRILAEMARGNAVTVVPVHAELTTQQAADLLGVSRPFLIRLLDEGRLPFRLVGTHRRIALKDVMEFKRRSDAARQQALDELTDLTQEMGEY